MKISEVVGEVVVILCLCFFRSGNFIRFNFSDIFVNYIVFYLKLKIEFEFQIKLKYLFKFK